jgi:hypothetical protein
MTQAPDPNQPATPAQARRRPLVIAWRIAAIALVVVLVIAAAHFLKNPGRFHSSAGADDSASWPRAERPVEPGITDRKVDSREEVNLDLRRSLANLLESVTTYDEGDYKDPRNQTAEDRRRFIEDRFLLPHGQPKTAAPGDVVPEGAQVLIVFPAPGDRDARMVVARVRKDFPATLAEFHKLYVTSGWKSEGPPDPKAQTDQGWLMRFTKKSQERVVYARPRRTADETLVAVYDSRF